MGHLSEDMARLIRENFTRLSDVKTLINHNIAQLPNLQEKVRQHYGDGNPILRHYHVCMHPFS